eukprot:CAMPEP_0177635470 /NCGR_PEP_ID=MMETSP0447-20121125/3921_1 /TAXON_ID=0 /ORGANISM="Stygamoeba regulata, Strain BSH-02190019" /LENGTH=70 /DNA_ID=CAMNT_0019137265 /DNA_START=32 /DNA_END=244 /DNA_ORIENTATION=-
MSWVKKRVEAINKVEPDNMRLLFADAECDDASTLANLKIDNDAVVYLVYKIEGTDDWEAVDIHRPPSTSG